MQFIVPTEARSLNEPDLGLNIKKVGCVIARVMLLRNMITVLFTSAAVDDFMIGFNLLSRSNEKNKQSLHVYTFTCACV